MIVATHANERIFTAHDWGPLASGVSLFFVLSGFILFHVYGETVENGRMSQFFLARFARVWPMHIATVFMFMVLMKPHFRLPEWSIVLSNITLVQSWIPLPRYNFSFNGVAWSISAEFAFYLLFPFLASNFSKTWYWKWMISAVVVVLTIALCQIYGVNSYDPTVNDVSTFTLLYTNPVARVMEFISGMVAYLIFKKISQRNFDALVATIIEVALIAAISAVIVYWRPIYDAASHVSRAFADWQKFCGLFPLYSALILMFAVGRGRVSVFMKNRIFVYLGEASFAVYMVHQIINNFWVNHFQGMMRSNMAVFFISYLIVAMVVAVMGYQFIERPSRKFILKYNFRGLFSRAASEV
ncbi:exopolysaccharide production protein ExoZ [Burkholderia multivorans]